MAIEVDIKDSEALLVALEVDLHHKTLDKARRKLTQMLSTNTLVPVALAAAQPTLKLRASSHRVH